MKELLNKIQLSPKVKGILKRICIIIGIGFGFLLTIPIIGSLYIFPGWFSCGDTRYIPIEGYQTPIPNATLTEKANRLKGDYPHYTRPQESTYLTFPEWWIVYSSQEYANHIKEQWPSEFPYFSSIGQFWQAYCHVNALSQDYPFNSENHIMLMVIGTSLTLEYLFKGIYENTIGWFTEWTTSDRVPEDEYAFDVANAYGNLIPVRPWYEFSFWSSFKGLWSKTELLGWNMIRRWERKIILSAEYLFKAFYAWVIETSTHATFGVADVESKLWAYNISEENLNQFLSSNPKSKRLQTLDEKNFLLSLPRYQPFTDDIIPLIKQNAKFYDIAGNTFILLSAVVPTDFSTEIKPGVIVFSLDILTDKNHKRIGVVSPVTSLDQVVKDIIKSDGLVEHIYDF